MVAGNAPRHAKPQVPAETGSDRLERQLASLYQRGQQLRHDLLKQGQTTDTSAMLARLEGMKHVEDERKYGVDSKALALDIIR